MKSLVRTGISSSLSSVFPATVRSQAGRCSLLIRSMSSALDSGRHGLESMELFVSNWAGMREVEGNSASD